MILEVRVRYYDLVALKLILHHVDALESEEINFKRLLSLHILTNGYRKMMPFANFTVSAKELYSAHSC